MAVGQRGGRGGHGFPAVGCLLPLYRLGANRLVRAPLVYAALLCLRCVHHSRLGGVSCPKLLVQVWLCPKCQDVTETELTTRVGLNVHKAER